jgi:ribosome-binding factor A
MISPEERMGVDNVISVMVTVSDVEVSNDLQVVKVFVSILGDERGKQNAITGLKKMEGYCRRNIGKKVSLRLTPEIRFVYDDSFERGQKVSNLLDDLRSEREGRAARGGGYTREELLAVEDTITNPYDDEEDDWEGGHEIIEDDDDDEEDDEEGVFDDEDIDIESVWDEMNKEAKGGDDMIDVK